MRAIARWTLVAGVVVSASTADWTGAQAPEGARLLSAQAIGESLAVLRKLQDSVARHYRNPAAWYHQGMIAAALYDRCRVAPRLSILDCTRPRPLADSAFMIARELEPENREYVLALGRFLLAADVVFWRDATYFKRLFDASLSAAKKTGNPVTYADATLDLGQYYWLEYDAKAHRDFETAKPDDVRVLAAESGASQTRSPITVVGSRGGGTTREAMTAARNSLNAKNEDPTQGFSGEIEYLLSEMLFREAFEAAPGYVRAYRAYETLLAERNRWSEVGAVSRERMRAVPDDGWAWMTAAMATYRAGNASGAIAAFDTAMRVLSPSERARVQSLDRVLGLAQRTRFDALQDTA